MRLLDDSTGSPCEKVIDMSNYKTADFWHQSESFWRKSEPQSSGDGQHASEYSFIGRIGAPKASPAESSENSGQTEARSWQPSPHGLSDPFHVHACQSPLISQTQRWIPLHERTVDQNFDKDMRQCRCSAVGCRGPHHTCDLLIQSLKQESLMKYDVIGEMRLRPTDQRVLSRGRRGQQPAFEPISPIRHGDEVGQRSTESGIGFVEKVARVAEKVHSPVINV